MTKKISIILIAFVLVILLLGSITNKTLIDKKENTIYRIWTISDENNFYHGLYYNNPNNYTFYISLDPFMYDNVKLYSNDKLISNSYNGEVSFYDYDIYHEVITNLDNLYLIATKTTKEQEEEKMVLHFDKGDKKEKTDSKLQELKKLIMFNFAKYHDNYTYTIESNGLIYLYNYNAFLDDLDITIDSVFYKKHIYYELSSDLLNYQYYENGNLKNDFTFNKKSKECLNGNCKERENVELEYQLVIDLLTKELK